MFCYLKIVLFLGVTSYHVYDSTAQTQSMNIAKRESSISKDTPRDIASLTIVKVGEEKYYKITQVDEILEQLREENAKLKLEQNNVIASKTKLDCNYTFKSGLTDVVKTNLNLHKKLLELEAQLSDKKFKEETTCKTKTQQSILDKLTAVEREVKANTKLQTNLNGKVSNAHNSTQELLFDLKMQSCGHFKTAVVKLAFVNIGGKTYHIDRIEKRNWTDASVYCRSYDLKLLSVEAEKEHQALQQYFTDTYGTSDGWNFWTSGKDESQEGTWMWTATGTKFTFTSRSVLQGGTAQNCMDIRRSGSQIKYYDDSCSYKKNIICEFQETCV